MYFAVSLWGVVISVFIIRFVCPLRLAMQCRLNIKITGMRGASHIKKMKSHEENSTSISILSYCYGFRSTNWSGKCCRWIWFHHQEFYSRSEDNSVFLGKRLPDCIEGAVNISNWGFGSVFLNIVILLIDGVKIRKIFQITA